MDGDEKLRREVAVMRLVRENTSIPVPEVHAWGLSNENSLGLGPFIIMDFVQGESLHRLWRQTDEAVLRSDISEGDLRTVYRQVAGFYLELSKLEFPHSIHTDLGPLTLKMQEIEAHGAGTFPSAREFFEYIADQDMEQVYKQANSVDDADDARAKYKFRHQFNALIPRFVNDDYNRMKPRLLCDDFRYGNMIIGREWAYAAPYQMLCSAPRWFLISKPTEWRTPAGAEFERYKACLELFLDELERLEVENEEVCEPPECPKVNGNVSKQLERLGIGSDEALKQAEPPKKLSAQMRKSMTDGTFLFHELLYDCYTDAENTAWKAICSLHPDFEDFTPVAEEELREFAERKVKELEAYKLEWGAIKAAIERSEKACQSKVK
ncbi:uncharacterized protein EI97DRAFT_482361 [Westerdykella ornata]|uniref:Aminoglycoside phosphotransferase domain-containing protein n=1 Tax=Westerdykella ornata TaxID=318751 RepID=A0A6A6JU80_WESOR|nr:uncharacterized protein EI97DRAFT_482361 [Westerdykella ornata]KAF2279663.1 hypothetical protein EI97DRAFT_482361 [Westerdykella ornata]